MNDRLQQNGQRMSKGDFSEFGAVRVISNPAPDAEDRLRRLFTLLLYHAARARQCTTETDALPDSQKTANRLGAEA